MKRRTIKGIILGVIVGMAVGISTYTFASAKGQAYLTDNSAACADCHVHYKRKGALKISDHQMG